MCEICKRIELIKQGKEPYFIQEYDTGYLSLFDNQAYEGYCLFIHKSCVSDLWDLPFYSRQYYIEELTEIMKKLNELYKPHKMNYCFLNNGCRHLHCHIIPNNKKNRTIWHRDYKENFNYDKQKIINKIRNIL